MVLELQVYERTLPKNAKKWVQKTIAIIKVMSKEFHFGRNEQSKAYISNIYSYEFVDKEHLDFFQHDESWVCIDKSSTGVYFRAQFKWLFLHFRERETKMQKGEQTQIKVGDKFVCKDKTRRKELVLEVIQL